ncbi:hypothetical protein E9993_00930 [Labilibacter sediminis]|nr:hypothetical protein E9993_00930 [Labilibacter sediminis]
MMEQYLKPGLHISEKHIVKNEELATSLNTGDIPYVATPSLIILMEQVICNYIHKRIPAEYTSVSAEINIKHLMTVEEHKEITCSVHLKFAEEQKLFFDFAIFNEDEDIVAIGAHERIIVKKETYNPNSTT